MNALIYRKKNTFNKKDFFQRKRIIIELYDEKINNTSNIYYKLLLRIIKSIKIYFLTNLHNLYLH